MADLNQFHRSKERIREILHLMHKKNADEKTVSYIKVLESSIETLDLKIEEFKSRDVSKNQSC
jgi:hypothetical protein